MNKYELVARVGYSNTEIVQCLLIDPYQRIDNGKIDSTKQNSNNQSTIVNILENIKGNREDHDFGFSLMYLHFGNNRFEVSAKH